MKKHTKRKKTYDINEMAFNILPKATKEQGKNPAAVMLGRLGGLKGGKARAEKLSREKRIEIARHAAKTRWDRS